MFRMSYACWRIDRSAARLPEIPPILESGWAIASRLRQRHPASIETPGCDQDQKLAPVNGARLAPAVF